MLDEFMNKGSYRRTNLKGFTTRMSKPNHEPLFDDRAAFVLKMNGFIWKEGNASDYDPEHLFEALERYSPSLDTLVDKNCPHYQAGAKMAYKIYAKPKGRDCIKAISSDWAIREAVDMSKSAGLPTLGKKEKDFSYALNREKQVREGIKAPAPCLSGARTAMNKKARLVWMYPFEMTLMEARFARPLIDTLIDRRTTMAYGMMTWETGALVDSISNNLPGQACAMDYSKFDSSIPSFLIKQAFSILGTWFEEEDKKHYNWDKIQHYFLHTPIVMPNGNLYTGKKHGVPSGSYFTQMIDSIVNTILIGAMSSKFKLGIKWKQFLVLGDDVICNFEQAEKRMPQIASYLNNAFGVTVNPEKQEYTAHFLGADWYHGKPHRNFEEMKTKIVSNEGYRHYSKDMAAWFQETYDIFYSYAATYYNAWRFLQPHWSPHEQNYRAITNRDIFLTGSERFLRKARHEKRAWAQSTLVERCIR